MRWGEALLTVPLILAGLLGPGCGGEPDAPRRVLMATTTSTANTGLLDALLPAFERETGLHVDFIAVGSGAALKHAENGDVDLVLVHAPEAEEAFVRRGLGEARVPLMVNDFVILGPRSDPASVAGAPGAAEAFARIAARSALFISRGDESGTHMKELDLWRAAGVDPGGPWRLDSGQGMGACLLMADEKQAYTLSDRATWDARRGALDLVILHEGDAALRNPYTLIAVSPVRRPGGEAEGARRLIAWLTSPRGQTLIGSFRVDGRVLFHPVSAAGPRS